MLTVRRIKEIQRCPPRTTLAKQRRLVGQAMAVVDLVQRHQVGYCSSGLTGTRIQTCRILENAASDFCLRDLHRRKPSI